jgi:poly [ADP-ribose] polymerase
MLPNQDKHENEIFRLNEEYFVIIPNRVENAREKRYLVFDKVNLEAQRKICSSLFDTLELMDDLEKGGKGLEKDAESQEVEKVFDVEIELLDMGELFQSITDHYQKSKNPQHGDRIMKSKIQKIFKVRLANQQDGFAEGIGNVQELWHGTRAANILSIMAKGLLMPSKSPGTKAGAMFGNGLYFANQSSKSLQYCDGLFWANGTSSKKKVYMFMATVALGKYEVPVGPTGDHGRPQKGYDSFWAKAGTSLVKNDEIIVFKGNQVRLDYLLEISFDD